VLYSGDFIIFQYKLLSFCIIIIMIIIVIVIIMSFTMH